jgi:hypothetical protein
VTVKLRRVACFAPWVALLRGTARVFQHCDGAPLCLSGLGTRNTCRQAPSARLFMLVRRFVLVSHCATRTHAMLRVRDGFDDLGSFSYCVSCMQGPRSSCYARRVIISNFENDDDTQKTANPHEEPEVPITLRRFRTTVQLRHLPGFSPHFLEFSVGTRKRFTTYRSCSWSPAYSHPIMFLFVYQVDPFDTPHPLPVKPSRLCAWSVCVYCGLPPGSVSTRLRGASCVEALNLDTFND